MIRAAIVLAACVALVSAAEARTRYRSGSAPIIAGQPSVRVTPSGNVVAPREALPRREINGRVRRPHHRLGPG